MYISPTRATVANFTVGGNQVVPYGNPQPVAGGLYKARHVYILYASVCYMVVCIQLYVYVSSSNPLKFR